MSSTFFKLPWASREQLLQCSGGGHGRKNSQPGVWVQLQWGFHWMLSNLVVNQNLFCKGPISSRINITIPQTRAHSISLHRLFNCFWWMSHFHSVEEKGYWWEAIAQAHLEDGFKAKILKIIILHSIYRSPWLSIGLLLTISPPKAFHCLYRCYSFM